MEYQIGDVVLVNLVNGIENRRSLGKVRPAVLVQPSPGHWKIVGLTTRSTYMDGSPRVSIPNPLSIGLAGPRFLWSSKLNRISRIDVIDRIGRVDFEMVSVILRNVHLTDTRAALLSKTLELR
jgi:hypothetical protein